MHWCYRNCFINFQQSENAVFVQREHNVKDRLSGTDYGPGTRQKRLFAERVLLVGPLGAVEELLHAAARAPTSAKGTATTMYKSPWLKSPNQ